MSNYDAPLRLRDRFSRGYESFETSGRCVGVVKACGVESARDAWTIDPLLIFGYQPDDVVRLGRYRVEDENGAWVVTAFIADDEPTTAKVTEMVEYWGGAEDLIETFKGDVRKAFAAKLGAFVRHNLRLPRDGDEGWYPVDGSHGVWVPQFDGEPQFTANDMRVARS